MNLARMVKGYIESLFNGEEGQDVFEYILIIAGISIVIIALAAVTVPGLFSAVLDALCNAINSIDSGLEVICPT